MCPDDNALAALVDGTLHGVEAERLRAHLADCDACRELVSLGLAPALKPGAVLQERYVVLHEVGSGAMGVVFAAWDNRLDRKVALKVLHPGTEQERHARLEREARALARLSHPHVVAVHDVGRTAEGLFVVMEFVEGQTLRQWSATPHPLRQVLATWLEAARGLAAAHAAGLVHRDFKPDNVLLGADGRARVSDFGLAQLGPGAPSKLPAAPGGLLLTRTGAQLGTPAYLAPEVFEGQLADARSDQFSYCVSLWEALTGQRPFSGTTVEALLGQLRAGRLEPARPGLPASVERALRRGLSLEPQARFGSMEALLAALAPAPARWPRALAVTATLVAGGLGLWSWQRAHAEECQGATAQLASTWNEARRSAVRAALSAATFAPSRPIVEQRLDAWAARWAEEYTQACRATVRREQSEALLDRRMLCLDAEVRQTRAVVSLLEEPAAPLARTAVEAVEALPDPLECSGPRVEQQAPPPKERARVEQLEDALAAATAQAQAGRYTQAKEASAALATQATALGWKPLEARALSLEARVLERTDDFAGAERTLGEALAAAEAARDDQTAVLALARLGRLTGVRRSRFEEGLRWVAIGRGALARLGDAPQLEAQLLATQVAIFKEAGHLPEALARQNELLALLAKLGDEVALQRGEALAMRGRLLTELGRFTEAQRSLREALALQERLLGPRHPDLVATLNHLGMATRRGGDTQAAVSIHERALALAREAFGHDSLEAGYTLNHLGNAYAVRGEWPRALEVFQETLQLGEKALGAEHHEVGMAHSNLCMALRWLRRLDEAHVECARGRAIVEAKLGEAHLYTAEVRHQTGALLRVQGRPAEGLTLERQAVAISEPIVGPTSAHLADALTGAGLCELALGHGEAARTTLERALVLSTASTPAEHGELLLGLARALPEADTRRCPLAREGVQALRDGGALEPEWHDAAPVLARCR